MGYLKGKSALMMFDKHANLKYKFGNRHFWAEGYYVSTVGLNEATIKKYIQEQKKHDIALDKLSVKDMRIPLGIVVSNANTSLRGLWRVKSNKAWTKWKPASLGAGWYYGLIALGQTTR